MGREFKDPYIDENTGVLRNLVGAGTYDELRNAEGELVALRMSELIAAGAPRVSGSLDDFKHLHRALFRDVYDWAGEVRTVEIRKSVEGSEFFLPSCNIVTGFDWAQGELRKDGYLKGMPKDRFASRLAYHYDNYNFIHPFREGNGRTQRLFWTLLAHDAGYDLDWRSVTGEENDEASRLAAEELDSSMLETMFARIAIECDPTIPLNAGLDAVANLRS